MTRSVRLATAALFVLCAASTATAAESPKIVGCRLGLGDAYKLGTWAPLRVMVEGGDTPLGVRVLAVVPDSDGVGVATSAPGGRPLSTEPELVSEERLYVRVGQQNAPIEVQLYDGGRRVHRRSFNVGSGDDALIAEGRELPLPLASRAYAVLQAGSDVNALDLLAEDTTSGLESEFSAPVVRDASVLPRDAIGYDGFDAVILVAGSRAGDAAGGWLGELSASDDRLRALTAWVESGGQLVLSCGAGGAALLGPGGALETFLPGEYAGPSSLANATAIEKYASAPVDDGAIDLLGGSLAVSGLTGVSGRVEAYAGRTAEETPLVVRTPRGFGEVTFVAFDLDAPSLAGWAGRKSLLRRLVDMPLGEAEPNQSNPQPWLGYGVDLVNRLLRVLDDQFLGIRTAPFLLIVGLVVLYLLLIGPGDYFFVKRVLGRVEATWVTFPLLVAATSGAAYLGAYWLKGDTLRVNQVEVIDIDAATGQTRGMLVTHLFSPRAQRYDLSLVARTLDGEPLQPSNSTTAWLGKPGYGLGGMRSFSGQSPGGVRANYQIDPTPLLGGGLAGPTIAGLPVQVWSTKTLVSRYGGGSQRAVEARLAPDRDGLVEGIVTNATGVRLTDCRLLYGSWAWRLGDLGGGVSKTIDPDLSPLKITTLLGSSQRKNPYRDWDIDAIAEFLSLGARSTGATTPGSRYLHHLDLTHHLDAGAALLLARVEGLCSELVRPEGSLTNEADDTDDGPARRSWVFARFILPVGGG